MKKTQLEKDLFYYEYYLGLLGIYGLSRPIALKDLGDTDEDKAVIQKCYRDLKKSFLNFSVIEYLCWISTQYILDIWEKESAIDYKTDKKSMIYRANKKLIEFGVDFLQDEESEYIATVSMLFLMICHKNNKHARNMVRLFNSHPTIIHDKKLIPKILRTENDILREMLIISNVFNILRVYEQLIESTVITGNRERLWNALLNYAIGILVIRKPKTIDTELINSLHFMRFFDD